jgi:hypothetical protein
VEQLVELDTEPSELLEVPVGTDTVLLPQLLPDMVLKDTMACLPRDPKPMDQESMPLELKEAKEANSLQARAPMELDNKDLMELRVNINKLKLRFALLGKTMKC